MESLKGKLLSQDELADIVGDMAAFMVFGQSGAAVGKTFNLRRVDKKMRRLKFKVTPDGARVMSEEVMNLAEELIDRYADSGETIQEGFVQKGWWLDSRGGRAIDVSWESGPGDHFGYLTAMDKGDKLFGFNARELRALRDVYFDIDEPENYEYDDFTLKFTDADLNKAFAKIHSRWIRVMLYSSGVVVQSEKLDIKTLRLLQDFLVIRRGLKDVYWENYAESQKYKTSFDTFITAGNLRDLRY